MDPEGRERTDIMENMRRLRQERGGIKSVFTKKIEELKILFKTESIAEVKGKFREIQNTLSKLKLKNDELIQLSPDFPEESSNSEAYIAQVETIYLSISDQVEKWLSGILDSQNPEIDEIKPSDSVSQSGKSKASSSSSSARLKLAARKAGLKAKAQVLAQQQDIKLKQIQLKYEEEKLTLESEIKATEAEEEIYEQYEKLSQISNKNREPTKPIPIKEHQFPVPQSTLNSNAPPWSDNALSQNYETNVLALQQQMLDVVQLPKTEIMTFDGDPLKYYLFIRSFQSTVDNTSINNSGKLNRLLHYCTGNALQVIQCCCVMNPEEGYHEALRLLQSRFGNQHVISNAWIRRLTEGPTIKPSDVEGLRKFADDLKGAMITLNAMGKINEVNNQIRMVRIIDKLPFFLQSRWRKKAVETLKSVGNYPSIEVLVSFVELAADELADPVFGVTATTKFKGETSQNLNKRTSSYSMQTDVSNNNFAMHNFQTPTNCPLCFSDHPLYICDKFKQMRPEKRFEFVQQKRLCFNCFASNHSSRNCRKPSKCQIQGCTRKHSRLIHLQTIPVNNQTSPKEFLSNKTPTQPDDFITAQSSACKVPNNSTVALPIVPVRVSTHSGNYTETYALLDTGSTNSFCSDELLNKLGISGIESNLTLTTIEKINSPRRTKRVSLMVSDLLNRTTIDMPYVFSTSNLAFSSFSTQNRENVQQWPQFKDLEFPEITSTQVSLIIGQDVPMALLPVEVRSGNPGEPYAVKTALGWVLNGPLDHVGKIPREVISNHIQLDNSTDLLTKQVERFWKLETCEALADTSLQMSLEDKRVIKLWDSTTKHTNSHYEISIPFKHNPPNLLNNYCVAESRLQALSRRLTRDNELFIKYQNEIEELLKKGFAEKVPENNINNNVNDKWYLPHHPVFSEKKPDKLRIVFDCASKYCGTSLNDEILQGPDLTNKLMGVLLRFREFPIGFIGDVEAMFHQVIVPESQRDFLRFLWWSDGDMTKSPDVYRMTVHLFGGVWSPSCANYALRRTAEDNQLNFNFEVVKTVLDNFYVDDCLKSLKSETEAISHVKQLCDLLAEGGFRLNKMTSSNRQVLESISPTNRAKSVQILDPEKNLPIERALGILWDTETDNFGFQITPKDKPITKRGIMSIISSVYDPLGFLSPYILQAKIIFQDECKSQKGWDEPLSQTNAQQWEIWKQQLPEIQQLKLARCVIPPDFGTIETCQLHHFSDASMNGYGAVSYLRVVSESGQIHITILMSKSRLAPIKQMTIPRLELSAAVTAVRLDTMLQTELSIKIDNSMFWTDSTIVLQYIRSQNKRFHMFVANRLSIIQDASSPFQWKHIESSKNPADVASRGVNADQLIASETWVNGPKFLWLPENEWPVSTQTLPDLKSDEEIKKDTKSFSTIQTGQSRILQFFERFSSFYILKKSVAWILRLKQLLRNKVESNKVSKHGKVNKFQPYLSVEDLQCAETCIIATVQNQHFSSELQQLENKIPIKLSSSIAKLNPILNVNGLLCVGGRLSAAPLTTTRKHPILLPKDCHVTTLVIRHYHQLCGHSGTEHTLASLRQKYWIVKGRRAVNKVTKHCFHCKKLLKQSSCQKMADLPKDRVTPGAPTFSYLGLDCFGPFTVRRGRVEIKRYGCVFTCLTTRAVHIEKLDSMDTDSFLNGFLRFISRRGRPKSVRSDNGTNFRAGESELRKATREWNQHRIHEFMLQREIVWIFNPPAASHMGGVWERVIRTIRKVLNAIINPSHCLDDEGLNTLFCEVESIINSRPITTVSENPLDNEPLTPNHLLLWRTDPQLPMGNFTKQESYRKKWKHIQYLADQFWQRWVKEYFPCLQQSQKWLRSQRNLEIGDIVLVMDERTPRKSWPLGRVITTFPGKDGLVRSVEVKTQWTVLTRPISKLCLLESAITE